MYHTLYETFAAVDEIYDRSFKFHAAVTALWGDLAVSLAESKVRVSYIFASRAKVSEAARFLMKRNARVVLVILMHKQMTIKVIIIIREIERMIMILVTRR